MLISGQGIPRTGKNQFGQPPSLGVSLELVQDCLGLAFGNGSNVEFAQDHLDLLDGLTSPQLCAQLGKPAFSGFTVHGFHEGVVREEEHRIDEGFYVSFRVGRLD